MAFKKQFALFLLNLADVMNFQEGTYFICLAPPEDLATGSVCLMLVLTRCSCLGSSRCLTELVSSSHSSLHAWEYSEDSWELELPLLLFLFTQRNKINISYSLKGLTAQSSLATSRGVYLLCKEINSCEGNLTHTLLSRGYLLARTSLHPLFCITVLNCLDGFPEYLGDVYCHWLNNSQRPTTKTCSFKWRLLVHCAQLWISSI